MLHYRVAGAKEFSSGTLKGLGGTEIFRRSSVGNVSCSCKKHVFHIEVDYGETFNVLLCHSWAYLGSW